MNKKYLYIIIFLLVIVILCMFTYKTSEKVVFNDDREQQLYDFGFLNKSKTPLYEHTFKYINTKYDSLKIYGVRDGCDCTESIVKKGYYLKNDTISVKTSYNPHKYNDSGITVKKIFLVSNKNISKFDTIYPLILKGNVR